MDGPIYGTQTSHEIHTHASYSTLDFRVIQDIGNSPIIYCGKEAKTKED